jgi:hypothetical protein
VKTYEQWEESTPYPEWRRAELRAWHDKYHGQCPPKKFCEIIKSFIKRENYLDFKLPRWILSRHDAFKAYSGRFFKAIEDTVYQLKWFIKHVPVPERPKEISKLNVPGMVIHENDYTALEAHIVPVVMNAVECTCYRYVLSEYRDDAERICSVLTGVNRLRTNAGMRAKVRGRRMSGDMCTSVGNGLTNVIIIAFIAEERKLTFYGYVEGDDGIFAISGTITVLDYQLVGFVVKIHVVPTAEEGHFCGMSCASDGTLLKDPARVLSNFGWTQTAMGHGVRVGMELLRAKSLSLAYEMPQCPVVGALARVGLAVSEGFVPRFDSYKLPPSKFVLAPFEPTNAARLAFADRYGVSVDQQLECERLIRAGDLDSLGTYIDAPPAVDWYAQRSLFTG